MYENNSGYDRGVSTFSPEGRIFQVEYAMKAIELGSCVVGVTTREGIVLGVEKRITSSLMEKDSVEKVVEIDSHVAAASSGLTADARTLIEHARVECQNHRFTFDEPLRIESLAQSICDLMMSFGEGGEENKSKMSRPFGVSVLLAGWDHRRGAPALFCCDPSGTYVGYKAHAIGNGADTARSTLEESWSETLTLAEAEKEVAVILRRTMEESVSADNVEIIRVTPTGGYAPVSEEELKALLEHAEAAAAAVAP
ncbi:hypothetical protein FNF29_07483 [Cafeteria roenbergensis]|uniref:Proteasome subunit alpha type n=1 Tax=Cafeteria roenbergensis TaxID=33653 RepID=A0A5A8C2A7_CAFRO|nr:hypothetical protein FNF29_07483 [Cafeteria roenbergensis]KAA0165868.1 hypothetical protein FNF28_03373 [Cafeteria roenbergensis]|eukprot:KAA0147222.1 hypothetical protein FNF29_07483 [Cafeteria roenbergensis]